MTNELIAKAKECKSAEELLALAKDNGIEMTAEEAAEKYAALNSEGELSDDELDGAAGGGCSSKKDDTPSIKSGDRVRSIFSEHACPKCGGSTGIFKKWEVVTMGTIRIHLTCDNPNCGYAKWKFTGLVEVTYLEPV